MGTHYRASEFVCHLATLKPRIHAAEVEVAHVTYRPRGPITRDRAPAATEDPWRRRDLSIDFD
jgi:hypothetical protein